MKAQEKSIKQRNFVAVAHLKLGGGSGVHRKPYKAQRRETKVNFKKNYLEH
jgi:hypothetical protein